MEVWIYTVHGLWGGYANDRDVIKMVQIILAKIRRMYPTRRSDVIQQIRSQSRIIHATKRDRARPLTDIIFKSSEDVSERRERTRINVYCPRPRLPGLYQWMYDGPDMTYTVENLKTQTGFRWSNRQNPTQVGAAHFINNAAKVQQTQQEHSLKDNSKGMKPV